MSATLEPAPVPVARGVAAGRGWAWWREAWALFKRAPGLWILLIVLAIACAALLSIIPWVGELALSLLAPAVTASFVLAARKVDGGGKLEIGDLALGFKDRLSALLVLGLLSMAATLVVALIAVVLGASVGLMTVLGSAAQNPGVLLAAAGSVMVVVLVVFVAAAIFGMAFWFAPALVAVGGVEPVEALKLSFGACVKNIVPFLVYFLAYIGLAIVASIPLGLGWFVLVPMAVVTLFTAYRDVFAD